MATTAVPQQLALAQATSLFNYLLPSHIHDSRTEALRPAERLEIVRSERRQAGLLQQL